MEDEVEEILDHKQALDQQSVVDFLLNRGQEENSNKYQVR